MRAKSKKKRLLGCFGGGECDDEDRSARDRAARAAGIDVGYAKRAHAEIERASKELEQLFPHIFLHRSPWRRVKDAFCGAKVASFAGDPEALVTVDMMMDMMSPFLREFLEDTEETSIPILPLF